MTIFPAGFIRGAGIPKGKRVNTFVECGCCGAYHRSDFTGDCRENSERFNELPPGATLVDENDNRDYPPIRVVFRVWKDDGTVLALFPEEVHNGNLCVCYAHIGQHGGADYNHCIRETRPATPEEYAPLARELESMGYALNISQRRYHKLRRRER